MDKKGLMARYLVIIIILVIGFAIILFFYWQYNWTGMIDKEICHQSIVLRTAPLGEKAIPLRCQTEKVCITEKLIGGKCEDLPEKEQVKVRAKTEKEINEEIANRMYDCWSMLGEGKLNFMPKEWGEQTYCFICSRIAFDETIKNKEEYKDGIKGLYNFLANENPSNKDRTYLQLFGEGEMNTVNIGENKEFREYVEGEGLQIQEYAINTQDQLGLVYIITKPGHWTEVKFWGGVALVGVGAGLTLSGIGAKVGIPLMGVAIKGLMISGGIAAATAGTATGAMSILSKGEDANHELTLVKYSIESLRKINCTSFEIIP